jgi:16S rRNA (uracil1498-N3)-methyltransferase
MRRFFLPQHKHFAAGDDITISGPEAKHITSVLRLKSGQVVEFFDDQGNIYTTILRQLDKQEVVATISAMRQESFCSPFPLTLAQCLLKGKKMDLLVQKATELGVEHFLPLVSRYCENHGERQQQQARWQRIMIEACKQSHRPRPMTILPVTALDQADFSAARHRLVAWEEERQQALPAAELLGHPGPICLLLGPEGGLHPDDLALLTPWQFTTFSLGTHILRGETAALAATAIVQYLVGTLQPTPISIVRSASSKTFVT